MRLMFLAAVAFAVYATHLTVLWWRGRRHREAAERGDTVFVVSMSERVAAAHVVVSMSERLAAELGREVAP